MANNRLNWDSLGADWTFSYNANVIERPFHGRPLVNCGQTEVTITGIIQPMIITCQSDYQELVDWFTTRSKLVRCPVFYRAPVVFEGKTSFYDDASKSIKWVDSPYKFSSAYFTGANSTSGFRVSNPLLPVEWKVDIRPLENGLPFLSPGLKLPVQIGAIPFYVKARRHILLPEVSITLSNNSLGFAPAVYTSISPPHV